MSVEAASPSASEQVSARRTVSLRELNQHSGRLVAEVVDSAQPLTITDRGHAIAQIVPLRRDETPYQRLLREGKIRVARSPWPTNLSPVDAPDGAGVYAAFMAERQEER